MVNVSQGSNLIAVQKGLTRTLLKFCQDHKYPDTGLLEVRKCLEALERGAVKDAG
jgi:hypothetical protein